MVELTVESDRHDGVTFVRATVTNTRSTAQRVQLQSTLETPAWPPRRGRVRKPEWDGKTWTGRIESEQCLGIGFASAGKPVEPPLEIVSIDRASSEEQTISQNGHRDDRPPQIIATLAEWAPPGIVRDVDQ